jgi:P27 family predicted phage terminase small subunit
VDLGIVSGNDVAGAIALCQAWKRYAKAIQSLESQGDVLAGERGSYVNPHHRIAKDSLADYMKLCPQFGIFPANRSRVTAASEQGKLDKGKGRFFNLRMAK